MNQGILQKSLFIAVIGCSVVLTNCNTTPQPEAGTSSVNNQSAPRLTEESKADEALSSSTITPVPANTTTVQATPTRTTIAEPVTQNTMTVPPAIPALSATAAKLPTATHTPIPSPTTVDVKCDDIDTSSLPDKAFPAEINISRSHIAFDESFMYMAVDKYIGVFDLSDPAYPQFWGFWESPGLSEISGLKVYNGVVYVTNDSTLHILNLSSQCRFASIATIDLPLHVFHLEIENSRLYVGGRVENQEQRQVAILSIIVPDKPKILRFIELGQKSTLWSVFEGKIYFYPFESNEIFFTKKIFYADVSNPDIVRTYLVDLDADSEILSDFSIDSIRILDNTIYLFSWGDGILIISNLEELSPTIKHNPETFIMMHFYGVQDEYIFIGDMGGCDGVGCDKGSFLVILSADTGEEISTFMFDPHTSILKYVVQGSFLYAFSEKWMYVVDISNINNPVIVSRVLLIT